MADTFDSGKHGAIIAIAFGAANLTTGESNTDLTLEQSTLAVMPAAGSVIGVSIRSSAIATGGTITAKPHKASTEYADASTPAPVLTTAAQSSYATARPGALTFDAGDTLGVSVTTTTTLQPTNTLDVDAVLFVQLDPS